MTDITQRLSAALADRYRLERHVGEGGMATVYLAHDLKHDRKVAVKVLRPELSAILGGERFVKEIKVTAGLQHPHILPLHDSGEADSFLYYVMPYIEGESLREKLNRDKQLSVEETVEIAKSVASALDYAHEQGIVHRDIKPENILLQRGQALVADFGIALAVSAAGGTRLTETGLSLGTPHYMSPEQATGDRELDARSDIYSLGAIVFEMLAGEPPHVGNSVQAIIAKILSDTPASVTRVRELVPANIDAALHRALAKSPADRFTTAGRFAEALTNPAFTLPTVAAAPVASPRRRIAWDRLGPLAAGLAALFLVMAVWALARPEPPSSVVRLSVRLPDGQRFGGGGTFDIAADGSVFVYEGPSTDLGISQLWVRRWNALDATPIGDTEGGPWPAVSPNGQEVAVIRSGGVRVVPVLGGVVRTLATNAVRCCARWGPDGSWIYFDALDGGVARVPSAGGPVEEVIPADTALGTVGFNIYSDVLPGGETMVYEATTSEGPSVATWDLRTGEGKILSPGQFPRYSEGYVVFGTPDGTTLMAAPFDVDALEFEGPATPLAEGLANPAGGWNFFTVSQTGRLLYTLGSRTPPSYELVWIGRDGQITAVDPDWTFDPGSNNRGLSLSPDGTRLAVTVLEDGNYDIWIKELPRGPASRLTFEDAVDVRPRWTPDGERVTWLSDRGSGPNNPAVFGKRATGTGAAELLFDHQQPLWEAVFSPDFAWLIARTGGTTTIPGGRDVWAVRPDEDTTTIPLVVTGFDEKAITLSPDGEWLAYESDETGRNEIYVRPFPDIEAGKWQVSTGGGVMPVWARTTNELFYVNGTNELVAVEIRPGTTFSVENRTVLFAIGSELLFRQGEQYSLYDITPDDRRFIMMRAVNLQVSEPDLIYVENWSQELKARTQAN